MHRAFRPSEPHIIRRIRRTVNTASRAIFPRHRRLRHACRDAHRDNVSGEVGQYTEMSASAHARRGSSRERGCTRAKLRLPSCEQALETRRADAVRASSITSPSMRTARSFELAPGFGIARRQAGGAQQRGDAHAFAADRDLRAAAASRYRLRRARRRSSRRSRSAARRRRGNAPPARAPGRSLRSRGLSAPAATSRLHALDVGQRHLEAQQLDTSATSARRRSSSSW